MNLKICSKCGKSRLLSSFYFRKKGPRKGKYYEKCKECMKARGIDYYHQNHDRQLKLALIRRHRYYKEKRKFLVGAKNRPCADCGLSFPFYVMDFDHRDYLSKIENVSRMFTRNWALEKIKKEVEKCDIVCANCHRIRTYKKFHKYE